MGIVASSAGRVPAHTAEAVNERIRRETNRRIAACARQGRAAIDERLRQLDREWDVERCIETAAAGLSLLGLGLGAFKHRRWYLLPTAVSAFLLQHALQGWCPPLPLLRRLGVRTADEINRERYALLSLREGAATKH
ncbi:MAG: hypothetical protein DIU71_01030 [Proteobacteria bacterium]|nr:MAG: hypothetical protein DIU71_01030 [Pseudomonadota bacterium]